MGEARWLFKKFWAESSQHFSSYSWKKGGCRWEG